MRDSKSSNDRKRRDLLVMMTRRRKRKKLTVLSGDNDFSSGYVFSSTMDKLLISVSF